MRWLTLLLVATVCRGATIHEELISAIGDADLIVIEWREFYGVEALGIDQVKARYEGVDRVRNFISHIQFEADVPVPESEATLIESDPEAVATIPRTRNCRCDGSHTIRAFRDGQLVTEISYLHSINFRSRLLDHGGDVELTEESREWLKAEIDWDRDIRLIEAAQKPEPIQSPQPTTDSSAVSRG